VEYGPIVGVCCFTGMMFLILVGVPIFVALLAGSFVGFWLIGGITVALTQFTSAPYYLTGQYTFAVLPLFLLMGVLAGESGIAEGAYNAAVKWLGNIRGGLLVATIGGAAVFSAASSSNVATAALFTKIALPELEKVHFDKKISMGCIAAASGLDSLIPPSNITIILCFLTQLSIGKLLVAGIIPGMVAGACLVICVAILGILNPRSMPKVARQVSWKEKILSLGVIWPIVCLFALVIGGIYLGWFSATAGASMGAFGTLLYGVFRRVSIKRLWNAFHESVLVNAQIWPIVIGGILFSRFLALTGLVKVVMDGVASLGIPALGVMGIFVVMYLFLGCVMDPISMLVTTVPFFMPVMTGLGFDPIALGIVLIVLVSIAGLTPPIGMQVFVVASVGEAAPMEVFRGVIPFYFGYLIVLCLLILFPGISTWLPNLFFGS
jgi:C4-dicarboxylate transporter, DctM subunit